MGAEDQRPGYWDIVIAYLQEAHRAWTTRDVASAVAVEQRLGLSQIEGHRFIEYLEELQLVAYERTMNALGAYHLLPKGLAFVEGLPTAEQMLATQAQAIARVSGPSDAEKKSAVSTIREAVLRFMAERGVEALYKNFPKLVAFARTRWPWLPDIGSEELPL